MTLPARILKGHLVSFMSNQDCFWSQQATRFISHEQGAVVIGEDGKIVWHGPTNMCPKTYQNLPCDDYGNQLILPGFIDLHLHFPQYQLLAAPGKNLLDWLERYTFPEELKYADPTFAQQAAKMFLSLLHAHGTTSAVAYCSVHPESVNALFTTAQKHQMALITGKTLMDRFAPDLLLDSPQTAYDQSTDLIAKWHQHARLRYAVTPRFAITSTNAQLEITKALFQQNTDIYLQSHLSESQGELAEIKRLFPTAKHYTDVYATYDLLGPRALYGHAIHLSEAECEILADTKTALIHCPTSNMFLGSGLFNIAKITQAQKPITTGLATDIGAGTSYSMFQTMAAAYNIAQLHGLTLNIIDLYYSATAGNAKILSLENDIGQIANSLYADLIVINKAANVVQQQRQHLSDSLEDILFYLMHLADTQNITATYIAGKRVYVNMTCKTI